MQDRPFQLRVHLLEMRPEDALEVVLPSEYADLTIGELLETVFAEDADARARVEKLFDVRKNPDLPEIYEALLEVLSEWRSGGCVLKFSVDDVAKAELSDLAVDHLGPPIPEAPCNPPYAVLDLMMEREYPTLDHAVREGYWEDKAELMGWLQSLTLLYFLDKHELELSATPSTPTASTEMERQLSAIAETLMERQIILPSEETGLFRITEQGRQFLGSQITETESYIDRYDIFKDVVFDAYGGPIEFGNGRGEDLRVQVFLTEGLDPVRTVFLLRLYDGSLDEFVGTWQWRIHDEGFFNRLLEPVMDHHQADQDLVEQIIENGFAHVDEEMEERRESLSTQRILETVGRAPGLPSDGEEQD